MVDNFPPLGASEPPKQTNPNPCRPDPSVITKTSSSLAPLRGPLQTNTPVRNAAGEALRVTHRYSDDVGEVLAEVAGASAAYTLKGDELYVRAKVISSKVKSNPYVEGEFEAAWTQPLIPAQPAAAP
jgi:hypothetical protein